jgi:hypothetical protein
MPAKFHVDVGEPRKTLDVIRHTAIYTPFLSSRYHPSRKEHGPCTRKSKPPSIGSPASVALAASESESLSQAKKTSARGFPSKIKRLWQKAK